MTNDNELKWIINGIVAVIVTVAVCSAGCTTIESRNKSDAFNACIKGERSALECGTAVRAVGWSS